MTTAAKLIEEAVAAARVLDEARGPSLQGGIRSKVNRDLDQFNTTGTNIPFVRKIPLDGITDVLSRHGIVMLQEDQTEWSGFLLGREGQETFDIGPGDSGVKDGNILVYEVYSNSMLALSWHKFDTTGKYEIITRLT